MRGSALLLLLVSLIAPGLSGCGARAAPAAASEASAAAIADAEHQGYRLKLDETLTLTGGDIPAGQEILIQVSGQGRSHDFRTQLDLTLTGGGGRSRQKVSLVLFEGDAYVRSSATGAWQVVPAASLAWIPAGRVDLFYQAALLGDTVQGSGLALDRLLPVRRTTVRIPASITGQLLGGELPATGAGGRNTPRRGTLYLLQGLTGGELRGLQFDLQGHVRLDSQSDRMSSAVVTGSLTMTPARVGEIAIPEPGPAAGRGAG